MAAVSSRQLTFQLSGGPPYGIRLQGGDNCPFVISKIRPASKAEAVGLQECDVIVAVNGVTSRGLSHTALTALMDSVNTVLNVIVLRGPTAFSDVETVQSYLGSKLVTLTDAQLVSLGDRQPEVMTSSTGNWSDVGREQSPVFRLQSVSGKQRQNKQHSGQPTELPSYSSIQPAAAAAATNPDNYYSRDEQSFNDGGVARHTVEETERKTIGGTSLTSVTRREYSTHTTSSKHGPELTNDFFHTEFPTRAVTSGGQDWFGERSEDRTYQTRTMNQMNQVRGLRDAPAYQQFTVAAVAQPSADGPTAAAVWTHHRGVAELQEMQNKNAPAATRHQRQQNYEQSFEEPQVRIYRTPGVRQAENIVVPDFQISIEASHGPPLNGDHRVNYPIVTVTPAEEHDNTLTLVGPPPNNVQQQPQYPYQPTSFDKPITVFSSPSYAQPTAQTRDYYEPAESSSQHHRFGTSQQKVNCAGISRDVCHQQQQQQPEGSYDYQSTPIEVTWHEPVEIKRVQPVVENFNVSIGERSNFIVKSSDAQTSRQPVDNSAHYSAIPRQQQANIPQQTGWSTSPAEDLYQNTYQTDYYAPANSANDQYFEQRSRPAPVTYDQPYQQPINGQHLYQQQPQQQQQQQPLYQQPSYNSNPRLADSYTYQPTNSIVETNQPMSSPMKIGNKLPMNPYFKRGDDVIQQQQPPSYASPASAPFSSNANNSYQQEQQTSPQYAQYESPTYNTTTNQPRIQDGGPIYQQQPPVGPFSDNHSMTSRPPWGGPSPLQMTQQSMGFQQQYQQPDIITGQHYDARYGDNDYYRTADDVPPPSGYMIAQQMAPPPPLPPPHPATVVPVSPAAPPPPAPPPPPANPLKVYGIVSGSNDPDKRQLESKINLANSVAQSVTSPANSNSRGQKMFLRRQQNAHKWTKSGPDPRPEEPRAPANSWSNAGQPGRLPSAPTHPSSATASDRWNHTAESGPVRTGATLLKRSDSADYITGRSPAPASSVSNRSMEAEQWVSASQRSPSAAGISSSSQSLAYRPVKFQFQKPAGPMPSQPPSQWNQGPAAGGGFHGNPNSYVHSFANASDGFTDL